MGTGPVRWEYPLARLYDDQDPRLAADAIAPLVCWLSPAAESGSRTFVLHEPAEPDPIEHTLCLTWQIDPLVARDPRLSDDLRRYRNVRVPPLAERSPEAAFGLGLVAISCLLGRRLAGVAWYRRPHLLLSVQPGALCGVQVAIRGGARQPLSTPFSGPLSKPLSTPFSGPLSRPLSTPFSGPLSRPLSTRSDRPRPPPDEPDDAASAALAARPDIAEAYLSVWCRDPWIAVWQKVKP